MIADSRLKDLDKLVQDDCHLKLMTDILADLTNIMKNDSKKSVLMPESWQTVLKVNRIVLKKLSGFEADELDFIVEYLRFIRNSCGNGVVKNQQFILSSEEILECVKRTVNSFKEKTSDKEVIVLKCSIQIIGNLVCLSTDAKILIWNYFLEQKIFQFLLQHCDPKAREYTMMVLFNCMTEETAKHLINSEEGHHILISLLDSLCNDLVDWGILFLEVILKEEDFFHKCYEIIPLKSRLLILDIILQLLSNGPGNSYFTVPQCSLHYIVGLFVECLKKFIEVCDTEGADLKALEIIKLLCLLGDASVLDDYSHVLKCKRELLETSLDILRCVHLLGKSGQNAFSRISDLQVKTDSHRDEIENNPTFGFKKNLIRLIGNLCYDCKENQDIMRELDGIPVLLDCCNIDARNPFILQWSILALRNIMEKNPENQAVLAAVSSKGEIDSAVFTELGFEAVKTDGKYILRNLNS